MEWNEVVATLCQFVLIPILPLITTYICMCIKKVIARLDDQSDNEYIDRYLLIAQDVLISVVATITETYVKSLKESGSFGIEEQKIAMNKAIEMFESVITDECKNVLCELYGDYNTWIRSQIETIIAAMK